MVSSFLTLTEVSEFIYTNGVKLRESVYYNIITVYLTISILHKYILIGVILKSVNDKVGQIFLFDVF